MKFYIYNYSPTHEEIERATAQGIEFVSREEAEGFAIWCPHSAYPGDFIKFDRATPVYLFEDGSIGQVGPPQNDPQILGTHDETSGQATYWMTDTKTLAETLARDELEGWYTISGPGLIEDLGASRLSEWMDVMRQKGYRIGEKVQYESERSL